MKLVFWLSLVVSILLPVSSFGFNIFGFGGCVIPFFTPIIASICLFIFLFLLVSSAILFIINIVKGISLWRQRGIRLFLPVALIILGFLATIPINQIARNICQARFQKHFSLYERTAAEIASSVTPDGRYTTPSGTALLSYIPPIAYFEKNGTLTIEFVVGGIGSLGHTAYLYRSNGLIEKKSRTAERWHRTIQVKDHWFRAKD